MSESTTPSDKEVPGSLPPGEPGNRATKYKYFAYNKQPWDRTTWDSLTSEQQQVVMGMNRDLLLEEYPTYALKSQTVEYYPHEPDTVVLVTIAYR